MIKVLISKWKKEQENKKQNELQIKIYELRHHITKFFEDLQVTKGTVEIPAWLECKNLMAKLKINIENPRIVNFYYKNLQKYKLDHKIL